MNTLALDCSTARGSVALVAGDGNIIWRAAFVAGRGHGGKLFAALAEARGRNGDWAEIVVGLGPGSYSGVRQAIAVATGLSAATGARLVGVPSPLGLETDATAYHAIGDARRGTFYYTAVARNTCVAGPELLPDLAALRARLAERPAWPVLTVECAPPADLLVPTTPALPLAERLPRLPSSGRQSLPLEPIYLRPPAITLPTAPPDQRPAERFPRASSAP